MDGHLLHLLYIMFIFWLNGLFELVFELIFIINDLLALKHLLFDILIKLLAVLFFFEFLPVPVDFDILFMWGDNFILDLIGTVSSLLFFLNTTFVFCFVGVCFDLCDCQVCLTAYLFKVAWIKIIWEECDGYLWLRRFWDHRMQVLLRRPAQSLLTFLNLS